MQKFKEEIFINETGQQFLCEPISENELSEFSEYLRKKYEIDLSSNFFIQVRERLSHHRAFNQDLSGKDLMALSDHKPANKEEVFVIWNYPNEIDKMKWDYLIDRWDYIWYNVSDEAVGIYFSINKMLILITDYNTIYY